MKWLPGLLIAAAISTAAAAPSALISAIQAGHNLNRIRALIDSGANVNEADEDGVTPLMHAAVYSTVDCMRLLVDKGANVNAAAKSGRTALMSAMVNPSKARLLIDKGADVNATSASGGAPLTIAAGIEAGEDVALLLLEKGARPTPETINNAARSGHVRLMRAIAKPPVPGNALRIGAGSGSLPIVQILLDAGAPVNFQDPASKYTALHVAAGEKNAGVVKLLLDRGAKPDVPNVRGYTPLMISVSSDYPDIEIVKMLLAAGADPMRRDMFGDNAVAWARKVGDTPIARLLGASPAAGTSNAVKAVPVSGPLPTVRESVQRAVRAVQAPGLKFYELNKCISCHHTSILQMAMARVRGRGIEIDESIEERQLAAATGTGTDRMDRWLESRGTAGGFISTASYTLNGFGAIGKEPDTLTAAAAHALAGRQSLNGSWRFSELRPPLGNGSIKSTALSMRAIKLYTPPGVKDEYDARVARARDYLRQVRPADTQGHVFQLLGLKWAGAKEKELEPLARAVEQLQRPDGGWAQRSEMPSDPYATAQALWALSEAAGRRGTEPVYQRGAAYLRRTQLADGSWHVKSRAFGFQPLLDTGFPHGRDQWISAAATGFAILALAPLIEEPKAAMNVSR